MKLSLNGATTMRADLPTDIRAAAAAGFEYVEIWAASSADASWLFPFERVEVFCHHATIVTREMESLVYSEGLDGKHVERSMHQLAKEEKWGYAQEDRAFIDAIVNETAPAVTALDGYKSVELVSAVYKSVQTGAVVSLQNRER